MLFNPFENTQVNNGVNDFSAHIFKVRRELSALCYRVVIAQDWILRDQSYIKIHEILDEISNNLLRHKVKLGKSRY